MKNLFQRTSPHWVRYSEYEWKTAENGMLYLTPTATAQPGIYDPLSEYNGLSWMPLILVGWNRRRKHSRRYKRQFNSLR